MSKNKHHQILTHYPPEIWITKAYEAKLIQQSLEILKQPEVMELQAKFNEI